MLCRSGAWVAGALIALGCGGGQPAGNARPVHPEVTATAAPAPTQGSTPGPSPEAPPSPQATASRGDPVEQLSSASGDGAAAAATAVAYVRAIATHDWPGVCATRIRAEREQFARILGSCEHAMESMFGSQRLEHMTAVTAGGVRRRGAIIAVDILQPGQSTPFMTLLLQQESSQWLLVDLPNAAEF
jgi:hypothetical protein